MAARVNCGEALVTLLESYGVDTVFGIPGVHTLDLYRGLEKSRIKVVTTRHEQGAGFMAEGYARVSGRPGVCFVITGPGVTNIATAMGQAYADSVPMLVIASVNETEHLGRGRGRLHEISDQRAVAEPLSGFSATAHQVDDVPELVQRAYATFESERPRPAYIEVPIDVLSAPASFGARNRRAVSRPAPDASAVAEAAEMIAAAKRPVFVAGGGAQDQGALLVELAELAGAAVVLTTASKGAVPDDHPLCMGATLALPDTQALLAAADLVLAVGTELSETDAWVDRLELGGRLVRIDIDPRMLYGDYQADVALHADAGAALGQLVAALKSNGAQPADTGANAAFRAARDAPRAGRKAKGAKHARVLDAIRSALPENGFVFSDATQVGYTGNNYFPCSRARSWFHPVGYCTLGSAMPAAIGAKLGAPSRPAVALIGDGGFMFTVQDLATAVEHKVPVAIVLWNNDGLGQIRDDMGELGMGAIGVNNRNPDFIALAKAFGCGAESPKSLEALSAAIANAVEADGPTIIEVREDAPYLD